jgi:hypothetical protein
MRTNRRNLLIGIGTAAVGSGAAIGSGALTQVQANRSLSVTTADDTNALISIEEHPNSPVSLSTESGPNSQTIISIDLSDLNDDATTTLSPILKITNTTSEDVGIEITTSGASGVTFESGGTDLSTTPVTVSSGGSIGVGVEVDTTGTVSGGTVTINADSGLA